MPNTIKYEDKFEYETAVSELKLTILEIKAIADSFGNQFVDGETDRNKLAIDANPLRYQFLFRALTNAICKAKEQGDEIDA